MIKGKKKVFLWAENEAIKFLNPNSNARRKVDGRVEAELIRIACGPAPEGRARWTLRLLAKQVSLELDEPVGKDAVRTALKKMNFDLT